eukprot:g4435.t1
MASLLTKKPDVSQLLNKNSEGNDDGDGKEKKPFVAPIDRYVTPRDAVEIEENATEIYAVGTRGKKVTVIEHLDIYSKTLTSVCLRSNLIRKMQGLNSLVNITNLELYDNKVGKLEGIDQLVQLTNLDLSYNEIRELENLDTLVNLQTLYCANNKIKKVGDGLVQLTSLTRLDLGSNRLRKLEGFETLTNLKELWLGRNKITQIQGIENLKVLRVLDVQSNRLLNLTYSIETDNGDTNKIEVKKNVNKDDNHITHAMNRVTVTNKNADSGTVNNSNDGTDDGGDAKSTTNAMQHGNEDAKNVVDITNSLTNNINLEELYLAHNNITEIKGIETLTKLNTLDFSSNKITHIENVNHLSLLEEFWMSGNLIATFDDIGKLSDCKDIKTVYLEHNPISKDFEYRKKMAEMLPSLRQIDSTPCRR